MMNSPAEARISKSGKLQRRNAAEARVRLDAMTQKTGSI